jgi:hypothetical protein
MNGNISGGAAHGSEPYFAPRETLDAFRTLAMPGRKSSKIIAGHYRRDKPDMGITIPNARDDVLMAVVNLRPLAANNAWCDGRHTRRPAMPRGSVFVLDHREA